MELRESGRNRELEREKRAREIQRTRILHDVSSCACSLSFPFYLARYFFHSFAPKINPESEKHDRLLEAAACLHTLSRRNKLIKRKEGEVISSERGENLIGFWVGTWGRGFHCGASVVCFSFKNAVRAA
jgi:hypothetical protein